MRLAVLIRALGLLVLVGLAGCASTPRASLEADALAKEFLTHPSASTIYVYRSPVNDLAADTLLYINGRLIASTSPGQYFRLDMVPGSHELHGSPLDLGQIRLDTRPGQIYVVSLDVIGTQSHFELLPTEFGMQRVRSCCVLYETVTPGLRPFLLR